MNTRKTKVESVVDMSRSGAVVKGGVEVAVKNVEPTRMRKTGSPYIGSTPRAACATACETAAFILKMPNASRSSVYPAFRVRLPLARVYIYDPVFPRVSASRFLTLTVNQT